MSSSSTIDVAVPDGRFSAYAAWPSSPGPHPVIIVLQEIFGVNEGIRSIADGYAAKGYIALAPDLFWRDAPGLCLSESNEGNWGKAFSLYEAYDFDAGVRDIAAVADLARTLPDANGRVGVTGYCMGGLLTYLSAARIDADAFAAYYGGGTDHYLAEAGNIRSPLLYHFAGNDEYISPAAQAAIRQALAVHADTEIHVYPGRDHAFARPGGHHYHAADATLANARTDAFFRRHLMDERTNGDDSR